VSKPKKFDAPLMVTTEDDWIAFWSLASDDVALRDDIECALSEGNLAPHDIEVWERVDKLPSRPRKGRYLVTSTAIKDGYPVEIVEAPVSETHIHAAVLSAKDTIVEAKAEREWGTAVWRRLDTDVETAVKVSAVYVNEGHGKKRKARKLA